MESKTRLLAMRPGYSSSASSGTSKHHHADNDCGGRLPVHVRCLLDEFANIGQIPKFEKLIATIRSREISACVILQAQSQLKAIYKDNAETIIGNCDATLFLGGKEKTTLKDMSESLGKETIYLLNNSVSKVIANVGASNFGHSDFFVESSYQSAQNKEMPCYLISKCGAEVIANKLTGEKGIHFTLAYVSRFNQMEQRERAELEALATAPTPRLGEINAYVRIIVRAMKNINSSPGQIVEFLKETYEPFGFTVAIDIPDETAPHWYTAGKIAEICGIYSLYGKPHGQAVACILGENLFISEEHKRVISENYGAFTSISVRYDDFALREVLQWLLDNELPEEIYSFNRTYHVQYLSE